MHDGLKCMTEAVPMWAALMAEADDLASACPGLHRPVNVEIGDEIRTAMPWMLASLSPEARAAIADWTNHVSELVAFVHRASAQVMVD